MKEFGSDFHFMNMPHCDRAIVCKENVRYYADGRHALQHLLHVKLASCEWRRIWIPEYFCYDVVDAVRATGIEVVFYPDNPIADDVTLIADIAFERGDVLLRMNYFGLRTWRDNSDIDVPVIEDHSHDLISGWAKRSNADYCIASLRKTLPIPEGGVLWSPKSLELPEQLDSSIDNELLVYKRATAMLLKRMYLRDEYSDKDMFRKLFIESESALSHSNISGCSALALQLLQSLPLDVIYHEKKRNWLELQYLLYNKCYLLQPIEMCYDMTPFAFVILFPDNNEREQVRAELITNNVYPAVLWNIPKDSSDVIMELSKRLLVLHCDARYSLSDMQVLAGIITKVIKS